MCCVLFLVVLDCRRTPMSEILLINGNVITQQTQVQNAKVNRKWKKTFTKINNLLKG